MTLDDLDMYSPAEMWRNHRAEYRLWFTCLLQPLVLLVWVVVFAGRALQYAARNPNDPT